VVNIAVEKNKIFTVGERIIHSQRIWQLWMAGILAISFILGLILVSFGPSLNWVAWLIYLTGAAAILIRPRYGLYLILFWGLIGDANIAPWFPFVKGFSSRESVLFINDSLIISPLEGYIVLVFISWFARALSKRKITLYSSLVLWAALTFLVFTIFGMVYGVGRGGNVTIALWEARPIFYLIAMIFLGSHLLEKREHASNLMWAAMLALFIKALGGSFYYFFILNRSLSGVESILEHSAAVQLNTIFIFAIAIWLYKSSNAMRVGLPIMIPFVLITYLASQRRAAILSLAVAIVLLAVIIFLDNRKAFYILMPPVLLISVFYLGAFWNSGGALGLPARAIKSVFFEDQASLRDQSSNVYRILENINTGFTIHQKPLTGVGFGQKFYVIIPMADISFFTWWQYLPHNSIIWIWLKTGVGGFISMLFLVGSSIILGTRVFLRMPKNQLRAFALTATLYLVMHFTYAYVDISWDSQSMLYIGTMIGLLNSLERIASTQVPLPYKRWPWQPQPDPEPGLIPLAD
jgi:hypothetical protein